MKSNLPTSFISILLSAIFGFSDLAGSAQAIRIEQTFSADTIIQPFQGSYQTYSLKISGNVQLLSDSSLVRVIAIDNIGNHFLIFETYPMIATQSRFEFEMVCDETCFLEGIIPDSIRIDIVSAFLTLNKLWQDTSYIDNTAKLQIQAKWNNDSVKIALMNQAID